MAQASLDTFNISLLVSNDSTPPTVPTGLVATPVATTQINVTWSSSTDAGVGLGGYQVFRNNVQIATTSTTTYSDTGLTADTTYDYNVTAFDTFYNISNRSATTSTSTLGVAPTTTPVVGGAGDHVRDEQIPVELVIENVRVQPTMDAVAVRFTTTGYAIGSIRYGTNLQYELGTVGSSVYRTSHLFSIQDLLPGVRYYFEIEVQNQRGDTVLYEGDFVSTRAADVIAPANVSEFRAYTIGDDVRLIWNNPSHSAFDRVRLMANPYFYPTDHLDGAVVYEGGTEEFLHTGVYPDRKLMYYTIFVLDEYGNYSSGATTFVVWPDSVTQPDAADDQVVATTSPQLRAPITFEDIEFVQNARIFTSDHAVQLNWQEPFTVRIKYQKLPEHLKTIVMTLVHPENDDVAHSFLLRVNSTATYYEARIEPLALEGEFPIELTIYDFATREYTQVVGTLVSERSSLETVHEQITSTTLFTLQTLRPYWWLLIPLLIPLFIFIAARRRSKEN